MKKYLLQSILLFSLFAYYLPAKAQQSVTHQNVFDTIPFIMEHHKRRLEKFAKEPMSTGKILFLGNSITEGGPWAELLGDPTVVNRGIGGDFSYGILNRLDEIIQRKPSKLFLLIGVNDIGNDIPDAVIANNVRKIVTRLKAETPATEIYIQSILPVNPEYPRFPQHYDKQYHVLMTNQLLYKVALDTKVTFVNLFPLFLDNRQRLDANLTKDGLHLNRQGYDIWVKHLKEMGYLPHP
ncbi:GDSL-type esterase/lipase family protein [uncultured Imperialibacter sp.]|uniref:GDSL-type esterase/lipase family protein n=1 Tax=uncultured Imperialibacter sp. TaxID=1672639 RepID=UPI0030DC1DA6|tara:strand:+ start:24810 stop:25523 length:714 start_codon:yes stop_codon:yes gene_type:complete